MTTMYSVEEILRQNVADLERELQRQRERADKAEAELKEMRGQEPGAFWWIGPDGKDNGGPYRGKPSDAAIDNARKMGCEPRLLYAAPVPAPAVPSGCVAHLTQLADDPCQCHCCRTKRREARALLQSAEVKK